jgi:hypothetical protein
MLGPTYLYVLHLFTIILQSSGCALNLINYKSTAVLQMMVISFSSVAMSNEGAILYKEIPIQLSGRFYSCLLGPLNTNRAGTLEGINDLGGRMILEARVS